MAKIDVPQSNYQSNQNYDIDVPQMFKHFVTGGNTPSDNEPGENVGIDDIRGQVSVSVTGSKTKDLIAALNISPTSTTSASTPSTTTPVLLAQESRCHALYRIIGFPVIAADQQLFYNPGFDVIRQSGVTRKITLADKITIASNVDPKFEAISAARENWAASCAKIFSIPESVEAGVLSLTSGTYGKQGNINKRLFAAPFLKDTNPFFFSIADQTYASGLVSLVGDQEVKFSEYQDASGNSIIYDSNGNVKSSSSIFVQHQHIISPFMVDPRIDFSIWSNESKTFSGLSKRIAVPFVPNATFLKVSSTVTAERPLIEKIIRDRLSQSNNTIDAGTAVSTVVQYVQSVKTIQSINIGSATISNIFSNSVFKTSQQDAFANCLSIIQGMVWKLVDSMRTVHAAQGSYYWLPQPSSTGPEGGCDVRDVSTGNFYTLSNSIYSIVITPPQNDSDIIFNQVQALMSSLTTVSSLANAVPDRGGFALAPQTLTFDASTSDSMGDLSTQTMETLSAKRNRLLARASLALQTIEMIMGEFSGLGLSDIIAITSALYIMPIADVLGFLDDDAYVRAGVVLGQSLPARTGPGGAQQSLVNTVNGLYQIMDQIFQDYLGNNALNQ